MDFWPSFWQAFYGENQIHTALYCSQPPEGVEGAHAQQLAPLKKNMMWFDGRTMGMRIEPKQRGWCGQIAKPRSDKGKQEASTSKSNQRNECLACNMIQQKGAKSSKKLGKDKNIQGLPSVEVAQTHKALGQYPVWAHQAQQSLTCSYPPLVLEFPVGGGAGLQTRSRCAKNFSGTQEETTMYQFWTGRRTKRFWGKIRTGRYTK